MLWEEGGLWRPGLESMRWELGEVNLSKSRLGSQSIERLSEDRRQNLSSLVHEFKLGPWWQTLIAISA